MRLKASPPLKGLNKYMNNFQRFEVVGCGDETQLQVGENWTDLRVVITIFREMGLRSRCVDRVESL